MMDESERQFMGDVRDLTAMMAEFFEPDDHETVVFACVATLIARITMMTREAGLGEDKAMELAKTCCERIIKDMPRCWAMTERRKGEACGSTRTH